jgi:2-polyprenyl-3-methyl-5-hydroxy-6-metoxy-1,4-benzoquinol methylase
MIGNSLSTRESDRYSSRQSSMTSGRLAPFDNTKISTHEVKICILCQEPGEMLYSELRDRLFSAPGVWSLFNCHRCGLVWLNPQPASKDIGTFYVDYFTHTAASRILPSASRTDWRHRVKVSVLAANFGYSDPLLNRAWRGLGKVGGLLPLFHDWVGRLVMYLPAWERGRLLDIGCGNGTFLAAMRECGWDVLGVEPDPEAARLAREISGLHVVTGTLEEARLTANSIDAITLNHVIEHVPDPISMLEEICRVLRVGGKLVIATPNIESLGHRVSGASWPDLDPPRHLHLFSLRALRAVAEKAGLQIQCLRSRVAFRSWGALALETGVRLLDRKAGQELILLATRSE